MKRFLDQKLKFRYLRAIAAIEQQQSLLRAADVLGLSITKEPMMAKAITKEPEGSSMPTKTSVSVFKSKMFALVKNDTDMMLKTIF